MKDSGEIETIQGLAAQLAAWDRRIFEISTIKKDEKESVTFNLVFSFEPEPTCDTVGYFWVANLLTRMEFEGLADHSKTDTLVDLSFRIGEQIFSPDRKSSKGSRDYVVLWPNSDV
jgi:hypothetical protein